MRKYSLNVGDYEKLNIVADNEVYKTELLEEKTQVEEQLKEKETIIGEFNNTQHVLNERIFYIV